MIWTHIFFLYIFLICCIIVRVLFRTTFTVLHNGDVLSCKMMTLVSNGHMDISWSESEPDQVFHEQKQPLRFHTKEKQEDEDLMKVRFSLFLCSYGILLPWDNEKRPLIRTPKSSKIPAEDRKEQRHSIRVECLLEFVISDVTFTYMAQRKL